jgi:hypothetical protein
METKPNKIINPELSVLLYKIFNDTLFLLIVAFALLLLADGLIPGFAGSYFSFNKIILLIFINLGAVIYLGKKNGVSFSPLDIKKNKLWLAAFVIFFTFLLIRALYKFSVWETVIIVISSLVILYLIFRHVIPSEAEGSN